MTTEPQTTLTPPATEYKAHDYVLYRDARAFWSGKPTHTFVCQVVRSWWLAGGGLRYDLTTLADSRTIAGANPLYMRLLPPAEAMHDIDTAPLDEADPGAMTPAAVAWLRRHRQQM
ncbi:hypothetical protein, partial [Streptacidiphilus anmyonensis]|uniref:hypothetical protein n=1 Tax=Streptacidiphilus anmyonensis TaxID=405782 RepID=UPI0007C78D33